jgi:hypothetical protein
MEPVSLQLPAKAPDYVELPPTFTLREQAGSKWLLTCPDGQRVQTTYDKALEWIRTVTPSSGSEVRFINTVGLIYKVAHLKAPPPPPRTLVATPPPQVPVAEAAPPLRLFLQHKPSMTPYYPWGDWRVRPWGPDCLEVEASVPTTATPIIVVAYLVAASNHPGINACARLGGMMTGLLEQRQLILASAPAQAALQSSTCLRPLMEHDVVDDSGLGQCSLSFLNNDAGELETLLAWSDYQPAVLDATPHTRFLVQRTFHIALELISEVLLLQDVLAANHVPQAQSIWDETDSALEWIDTNIARAGRILGILADIFN